MRRGTCRATRWAALATLLLGLAASEEAASSLLSGAADAPAALALLSGAATDAVGAEDVQYALQHGWWEPAKHMLRTMRERGDPVATLQSVRTTATQIRDEATEIINLLRVGANKEETMVNCAFQWAQRPDYVYLNIKFSSRIDGPVTVLNVDNEKVTFTNETVSFEGTGRQKPKKFQLNLVLNKAIDPERSTWSFASVGRISITLAKVEVETWPKLLAKGETKPKNMYDRQTMLDEQVKKEAKERKDKEAAEKEAKEKAEKAAKEEAEKAKAPSAPEGGDAPAEGAEGAAPPTPPADGATPDTPPPPPKKKKGKKGKKAKEAKEEL